MSRLSTLTKLVTLSLTLGTSLIAQDSKWVPAFKFFAGSTMGGAKELFLPSNTSGSVAPNFGGAIELAYKLDGRSALVFDLGLRYTPGDNGIQSFLINPPTTAKTPAWVIGDTYASEARARKIDGQGWQASALYRHDAFMDGLFWQAGLRIGFNKTTQTDTGSSAIYTVTAVSILPATLGVPTWSTPVATAIASVDEKKTTAIGILAGLGYRFDERYSGELNAYQTKFEGAAAGKKSGTVVELAFGVRF